MSQHWHVLAGLCWTTDQQPRRAHDHPSSVEQDLGDANQEIALEMHDHQVMPFLERIPGYERLLTLPASILESEENFHQGLQSWRVNDGPVIHRASKPTMESINLLGGHSKV